MSIMWNMARCQGERFARHILGEEGKTHPAPKVLSLFPQTPISLSPSLSSPLLWSSLYMAVVLTPCLAAVAVSVPLALEHPRAA